MSKHQNGRHAFSCNLFWQDHKRESYSKQLINTKTQTRLSLHLVYRKTNKPYGNNVKSRIEPTKKVNIKTRKLTWKTKATYSRYSNNMPSVECERLHVQRSKFFHFWSLENALPNLISLNLFFLKNCLCYTFLFLIQKNDDVLRKNRLKSFRERTRASHAAARRTLVDRMHSSPSDGLMWKIDHVTAIRKSRKIRQGPPWKEWMVFTGKWVVWCPVRGRSCISLSVEAFSRLVLVFVSKIIRVSFSVWFMGFWLVCKWFSFAIMAVVKMQWCWSVVKFLCLMTIGYVILYANW